MKLYTLLTSLILGLACSCFGQNPKQFAAMDLRCEDLVDPIGIDIAKPRLSWKMRAEANGAAQTAYQILCATAPELLKEGKTDLWDSGKVSAAQSQHILYSGKALSRNLPCYWAVRIWNEAGDASAWSKPGLWTFTDLNSNKDWSAQWITDNTSSPWPGFTSTKRSSLGRLIAEPSTSSSLSPSA